MTEKRVPSWKMEKEDGRWVFWFVLRLFSSSLESGVRLNYERLAEKKKSPDGNP